MQSDVPQQPPFVCEHCGVTFQRREHLNRHVRRHLDMKPFGCSYCRKSFSRMDTLKRHTVTHEQQHDRGNKRSLKACSECARSKQRCIGKAPCDRCQQRGLICHILDPSTSPAKNNAGEIQGGSIECNDIEERYSPSCAETVNMLGETDPLNQYWMPQDFGLPFLFPFEADPPSIGDVVFYPNNVTPSVEDATASNYTYQMTSAPLKVHQNDTSSTPESSWDESTQRRTYATTPMGSRNNLAEPEYPGFPQDDVELLVSDEYCQVLEVSDPEYVLLRKLVHESVPNFNSEIMGNLPEREVINVFVQLYFEFFHPSFHLLRQAAFQTRPRSPFLLLAVAAIGAQYSRAPSRGRCSLALLGALRHALINQINLDHVCQHDLQLVQATILCTLSLSFCGKRHTLAQSQHLRSMLVTMCRPFMTQSILYSGWTSQKTEIISKTPSDWVARESWARVMYFMWYIEFLQWTFYDLAPLISVSELRAFLPCNDEVWQSSDFLEQQTLPPHFPGVLDFLSGKVSIKDLTLPLGSSASLFIMISAFAKDRSLSGLLQSIPTGCSMNGSDADIAAACTTHSQRTNMLVEEVLSNFAVVESLDRCRLAPEETSCFSRTFSAMKKIHSISMILDHVPYTVLYVSCGWMASKVDTEASLKDLEDRLRSNPQKSRRTLTHAAQLFRRVRNQKWLDACDPLYLLLATLYIWFYRPLIEIPMETDSTAWPPLKIDDESLDKTAWLQWVETGDKRRPHIGGIGFLNGRNNRQIVLKEAIRVLSSGQGWQDLAQAVAGSLQKILSGLAPSFPHQ